MMRSFISSFAAKFTCFQVVVAGDDLDVDVLGDGGEGDLEAADGGRVGAPRLHVRQPGALHSGEVSQKSF